MIGPAELLGGTAAHGTAAVLLWAGIEKARAPGATASTLEDLGVGRRWAGPAVVPLVVLELAVALSLVVRPGDTASLVGVGLLGAAFALAGGIAVRRDERIRCACFGRDHDRVLGWTQVLALPVWIAAGALAWSWAPAPATATEAAVSLCAVGLLVATVRAGGLVKELVAARGDRRSTDRMHPWLRS